MTRIRLATATVDDAADVLALRMRVAQDAIRLEAFDADAGAGGLYRQCGFTEVGRASYRGTPLIYFEMFVCAR